MKTQETYETVGDCAGLIWRTLDKQGVMELEEARKLTNLTNEEFHLAVGWLLREHKLVIFNKDEILMIQVVY